MDVDVLVVGSVNEDVVVSVERLPDPGETLLASELATSCGGKGANQAVAAARGGVRVAMAGAVGDDEAGRRQAEALEAAGVDIRWLRRLAGVPTGTAFIQVDARGENTIVVAQGANTRVALPAGDVEARVIVTQNEIPPAVQRAAGELAVRTRLRERTGARSLVMTLGARGALVDDGTGVHAIPPVVVERVVDATGAGDTFVGVLAARLALDEGLVAAASAANRSAAEAVTWPGARPPAE